MSNPTGSSNEEASANASQVKAPEAEEQAKYKATCDNYVENGLTQNRTIQFLIQQLDKMGCNPPDGFIRCTDCGYLKALGAFHLLSETKVETPSYGNFIPADYATETAPTDNASKSKKSIPAVCSSYFSETLKKIGQVAKSDQAAQDQLMEQMNTSKATAALELQVKTPEIFLCQQHLSSEGQAHRTIVHELIHAIDTCRSKMDPEKNCIHLACTEIRAENLSSECTFWNEFARVGPHSLKKHGQDCVRRRALLSVSSHPRCRDRAEDYVDAAMGRCYRDIFPFERHPNEQN